MARFLAQTLLALIVMAMGVDLGRPILAGARASAAYAESQFRNWQVCGLVVRWTRELGTTDCLWTATARANQESRLVRLLLGERAAQVMQSWARDGLAYGWSLYMLQAAVSGLLFVSALGSVAAAVWNLVQSRQLQTGVVDPPELEDWD